MQKGSSPTGLKYYDCDSLIVFDIYNLTRGILKILNRYCNTRFSSQKLKEIAAHIGADVPYFIDAGTQKITGFGEITRNINNPKLHFYSLMVFPETKIPTPFAYQCLDEDKLIFNSYENQIKLKMMIIF